jgi:hypothetical protein
MLSRFKKMLTSDTARDARGYFETHSKFFPKETLLRVRQHLSMSNTDKISNTSLKTLSNYNFKSIEELKENGKSWGRDVVLPAILYAITVSVISRFSPQSLWWVGPLAGWGIAGGFYASGLVDESSEALALQAGQLERNIDMANDGQRIVRLMAILLAQTAMSLDKPLYETLIVGISAFILIDNMSEFFQYRYGGNENAPEDPTFTTLL